MTEDDYAVSSSSHPSPRTTAARSLFLFTFRCLIKLIKEVKLSDALLRVKELEQLVEHLRKKANATKGERSSESRSKASQVDDELSSEG